MPDPDQPNLRWLALTSVLETLSLAVLLINLATVHLRAVASSVGPVHGFAYLATIAIAFLLPLTTRTRLLTLIPIIGGLLALRGARSRQAPVTEPASPAPKTATDGGADEQLTDQDDRV